ncbi:SDR family NAD(P)-dependent oxidoreductase [Ruegeria meonggei]|uniref:Fatty acyl-CoA reductase n=1 Tax=Ruegeria meonggei TaxID=1446476 RepID=A0A1X6ZM93_9RHOB|nr:SDR family NAD(P)-dependent oxidoreductase [Ruegeria meonggei]SLN55928.1 Fatty acyl-CoA reductase [Ruegeria meonggei]
MTKTILITGSTDGIGLLTAKKLIAEGHNVLLHGRSMSKLESTTAAVGGNAETYVADLRDLSAVRNLAENVRAKHDKLDVLINNAGVLKAPQAVLANGQDIRFVVNTLAPFLLTELLLPIIPADGRVVNLSSAAQAPVNINALRGNVSLADMEAYAQSKLAITIWTREWPKTLTDAPVMVAVNPGSLLASKMVKEGFGLAGNDMNIGADILIDAALGARFADMSGAYFDNDSGAFADPHAAALDENHSADVMNTIKDLISQTG